MTTKERRKHQIHPSCRGLPRYPEIPMSLGTGNRHAILVISPPFILPFSHSPSVWWWKNLGKTRKNDIPSLPKKTWHVPSMKSPASVDVLGVVISPVERIDRAHHRARIEAHLHQLLPRLLKALGPRKKNAVSLGKPWWNGDFTRGKCWFNWGQWWFN